MAILKRPKRNPKWQREYEQTFDGKYTSYKYHSKQRGYSFTFTKEDFRAYWQQPCYYCGFDIKTIGLDRVDNTLGYSPANCVSCCQWCNVGKGGLTQVQWLALCSNVVRRHGLTYGRV